MTNTEIIATAIVGGFTVLGAAIRWSASIIKGIANRIVRAIDDSTAAWRETSATVTGLTKQLVSMEAKLDMKKAVEAAVEDAVDEVSGVHEAQQPRNTPQGGYMVQRDKRRRF
jgi:hypothetical protein